MAFCTSCGAPTGGDGSKFCTKCGAALLAEPAGPEPQTALTTSPAAPPSFVSPPGSWPPAPLPPAPLPPVPSYEFPPAGPSQPVGPAQQAGPGQPVAPSPLEPFYRPPEPTYQQPAPSWQPGPPTPSYQPPPPSYPQPEPSWQPEPPGQPPRRTAMWVAVAVAAVLVLGGGGFAAWKFLLHHTTNTGATGAPTAAASQPGSGGGSPEASTPTPAPTASTPAQTTPSAAPPTPGSGFPVAATATVAAQPGEQQVVAFLQAWFTAINTHNYGEYTSLVTSSQRPTLPGFESGFGSTTDSNATLTGLAVTANGMAATLTFTSHQQPSASPTGTLCDKWHITLFLQAHNGGYRDGAAPPGYHAHDRAC